MRFQIVLASLAVAAAICLIGQTGSEVEASSVAGATSYYGMAKEYVLKKFNEKVLSRSAAVAAFKETMRKTEERFQADVKAGKIDERDESAASTAYHKILIDELKKLRASLAPEKPDSEGHISQLESQLCAQDKMMEACNQMANGPAEQNMHMQALNEDMMKEEEQELELEEQRRDVEKENEMGWSLSPEAREALKVRTKAVFKELLSNEIRQLALAVLQAYMTGGTITPVLMAMSGALKFKVVQYFMNVMMDMIQSSFGQKIEIEPLINPAPTAAPIAAAA